MTKLWQAQSPTVDKSTDPDIAPLEPEQSTDRLTAEETQVVVRMRKESYSKLRIAEFLGRHMQVVHDALHQHGSIDTLRTKIPRFKLSVSEVEELERLRLEGVSWPDIRRRMSFDIGRKSLTRAFEIQMKAKGKPMPATRRRAPLVLSSTDLQAIADLRKTGASWRRIAGLTLKGSHSTQQVQHAYLRQSSPHWHPPHELTKADLRVITRLRQGDQLTLDEIKRRYYPTWDITHFQAKFRLKMIEEDADPASQDPYASDAARLRDDMKSWLHTIKSKYPKLHIKPIWEQVFEEDRDEDPRRHRFQMTAAEYEDVL